jgi:hypothetical protein
MFDTHTAIDVGTLVATVLSVYLACRRASLDAIEKLQDEIAEHRGALIAYGILRK